MGCIMVEDEARAEPSPKVLMSSGKPRNCSSLVITSTQFVSLRSSGIKSKCHVGGVRVASLRDMPKPRLHALHALSLVEVSAERATPPSFPIFLCRGMFVYVCAEIDMYAHMAVNTCKPEVSPRCCSSGAIHAVI